MEKVFHEKSSEEKILPEYFFHLEQIFLGTNIHWQAHWASSLIQCFCNEFLRKFPLEKYITLPYACNYYYFWYKGVYFKIITSFFIQI